MTFSTQDARDSLPEKLKTINEERLQALLEHHASLQKGVSEEEWRDYRFLDGLDSKVKNYIIYWAYNWISGKVYIGYTKQDVYERITDHVKETLDNSDRYFHRALRKYPFGSWDFTILDQVDTKKEAKELEVYYIAEFKSNDPKYGYNMTKGGDGGAGAKIGHSVKQTTKDAIGNANRGRIAPQEERIMKRQFIIDYQSSPKGREFLMTRKCITNGLIDRRIHKDDPIPEGFWFGTKKKGQKLTKKRVRKDFRTRRWITNGEEDTYLFGDNLMPERWHYGRTNMPPNFIRKDGRNARKH